MHVTIVDNEQYLSSLSFFLVWYSAGDGVAFLEAGGSHCPSCFLAMTLLAQVRCLNGFFMQLRNLKGIKSSSFPCYRVNGVFSKTAKILSRIYILALKQVFHSF